MHLKIFFVLFTIMMLPTMMSSLLQYKKLTFDSRPTFSNIPPVATSPRRDTIRRKIVLYHNFFRIKVKPTASNMLLMSWHQGAAEQAQKYAEQCVFLEHNAAKERNVPKLGSCGQNLYTSTVVVPWFQVLKSWFLEYKLFRYGYNIDNFKDIGHYTQMVWATTHKVGCGMAHCTGGPWGHFYNYVCNYCPGGNTEPHVKYPYKPGPPCGDCPGQCVANTLCVNTCNAKDMYSNCGQLVSMDIGACSTGFCNATCNCENKLHKEYPWK